MKINLSRFEETQSVRKSLFERLRLPPDVRLDLAFDMVHGLNEITRSLADLHPHKRSVAILGAQPSPIAEIMVQFASQGFNVQYLPVSFLQSDQAPLRQAWETLKKDTLFILSAVTEPLTGAYYPYEWLRKEATKKNIFTVLYQSHDSLSHGLIIPESPFEAVCADPLWGHTSSLNLILKGERCVGERLLWGEARFDLKAIEELEAALLKPLPKDQEDKKAVIDFENKMKMSMGSHCHFVGDDIPRVFDRAVTFIDGAGGEALVRLLAERKIEAFTAAACAWDSPHLNSWLPKLGFATSWVQSSIILPLNEIRKTQTLPALLQIATDLRKISAAV